ncbi:PAS domain S-box protein [aff. Roholtiella sp. LEGE 12411]|uniref:PAS domain S-box protein n=1 Tax=aff. Roholtiella sp. LEGE 12411 TaxID=1828822 RepID=UPI0018812B36|nr:PAS domain S-box protein [aff. Roholtiella sp. LEGE 12411]MBE9037596.1 PAS domain S-box protein [aff. Roholtiella sp. LEGE 12411]
MPHTHRSPLLHYSVIVLIVALALLLTRMLYPWLGMSKSPFLLFFSAVMVSAWYGGLKSGLLATFLSALLSNYFFLFPRYELTFDLSNLVRITLFALEGLLLSILCEELITAKQRAEGNLEKLKTSEERFRLALSSSDIVVFQQDRDLRYQWIHNPQGVETAEEMLRKSDYELFSASEAKKLTAIKQRVIETGTSAREEVYLTLSGEDRYYDLLVEPLKNEGNNSIQGVSCAAVNITERKQTELENTKLQQKLQEANQHKDESLALLNAWLTSSPVALAFLDTQLRYVYVNEALAAVNGTPQSQHIGRTLGEVLPEWVEQLEPILRQVMETKEPLLNQEVSGETYPPGVHRCSLVSYYPVCLPDGQVLGVGVTAIDITQLKQTEQALRESEAKFRSVVESNMIGIGFWDEDGRITGANDALLSMVGYSREELVAGKLRWQDLTPTEYQPLDKRALSEFQDSLFCAPYEKEYIRKDGSHLPILIGGSHFEGTLERGAFFVLDITERKQAENALRCIAEISTILSSSLDYEETLEQIAKILVPQLADWCCVDILNEDGSVRRLPVAHANSSKAEWAHQLQQYAPDFQSATAITRVLQTGQPELITQLSDSLLVANSQNNQHLRVVQQMGIKSAMIVPLVARQRVLGSITFVSAESDRHYEQRDLALAKDIAYRAALAFENARLYGDIHEALLHYAESLSILDALLAGAPVAVCFLDSELRYIRINKVFANINGLSIEDHLGRKFREVLPNMAAEFEPQLQHVLDTGEPLLNIEISGEIPEQPGRCSYWLGNYYPVYNALSETVGIGIILADVTAAKQTEVALRESEEKFRAMFNQAVVGINLVALDGRYLQVNPAMCDIIGYSNEELTQMTFQEITHPDDMEPDLVNAQRVLAREISGYSLEKRYICKDGSIIWVNLTSSIVWDANGQPKYALGVVEDISDRKKAEIAKNFLVEASTLLASSLDYEATLTDVAKLAVPALADWCIVDIFREDWSNKQIALVTADPGKRNILEEIQRRYSSKNGAQELLVQKLRQGQSVFYPQFLDITITQMAQNEEHLQLLRSLGIRSLMVIPLRSRGQLFGAIAFFTAESGRHYEPVDLALAEDIASRAATAIDNARLYEAEQSARNQAETANRIKDEFLAVLSHELRTPLNPILGWAKLLRTRKFDEATVVRALETIERNAKLQTQLIEDLLDVSRILRGKLSLNIHAVDLNSTIAAALETVRLAAEAKSIQIQMVLSSDVGQVMGDGDRLQQVIWNLVSNAVKFTPPGGRVEVRLQQVEFDAQIQVMDTGKGISPEFLPHVFEYFRQADAKTTRIFGGLGLGLAIVRNLVELHGGTVQVESAGEGQGATFTVRLPLLKSSESQVWSAQSSVLEASNQDSLLSGVRILLVDDQPDVRDFFSFALEQYGANVTTVESASEALEALVQLKPDVLLSDIGMPIMDGYMLLREVRTWSKEQGGQIPAIALTAYAGEIDYNQAIAAGFQKHVRKPADPLELATAIANLIGRNQP